MSRLLLFQGDSITDVGRTQEEGEGLGQGYVRMIADYFRTGQDDVLVLNRGISGNRTRDLKERWSRDCIALQPDVLTLMVGINDCWRKYDNGDETPIEIFEENLDGLLRGAAEETDAAIILMEPFVLPATRDREQWRETLDPEIQAVRRLAKKYQTKLITLDGIFAKAAITEEYTDLAADGVHPTQRGHRLIADEWLCEYNRLCL